MSRTGQMQISKKQANAGSGAAGIGLGTAMVMLVPTITTQQNMIEMAQLLSPTISVAGAFIFKAVFVYFEKKHRLSRISLTTKHIDTLVGDEKLSPQYKSQLVNKKQELHLEEIELMSGSIFNDIQPTNVPNKSLKQDK